MNKEEIDKWLNNEYGVSYTRLEELHDFLIEQNMKYQDKIANLQEKIDQAIEYNEHLIRDAKYHLNLGHLKKMKKILLGDK